MSIYNILIIIDLPDYHLFSFAVIFPYHCYKHNSFFYTFLVFYFPKKKNFRFISLPMSFCSVFGL